MNAYEAHELVVADEGDGYKRATCTCGSGQPSPSTDLTDEQAKAWYDMHARVARTWGPGGSAWQRPRTYRSDRLSTVTIPED